MKLWSTVTLTDKCSFTVIANKPQVHITVTLQYTTLLVEWFQCFHWKKEWNCDNSNVFRAI